MIRVKFSNVSKSYSLINTGGIKTFIFNLFKQIKEYKKNKFIALENISFEIKDKEVVGIIGRNGAGKSTTLGLIAQVLSPTSGEVEVNGRIAPLLELGAGFHQDLTGRENIILNALLLGMSKSSILSKIDEIISFAELEEFIDQPIRMYSSGMMARLGFSIAIQTSPDILLIDEVLSVGDQSFQNKSKNKIFEFKNKGVTIIFVSHEIDAVEKLCDKVVWIENHHVKLIGTPEEVIPEYKKAFE
jgi:lipopolysaccharide transport system ATP-binding protein